MRSGGGGADAGAREDFGGSGDFDFDALARGGKDGGLAVVALGGLALLPGTFLAEGACGLLEEGPGGVFELAPMAPCYQGILNLIARSREQPGRLLTD